LEGKNRESRPKLWKGRDREGYRGTETAATLFLRGEFYAFSEKTMGGKRDNEGERESLTGRARGEENGDCFAFDEGRGEGY